MKFRNPSQQSPFPHRFRQLRGNRPAATLLLMFQMPADALLQRCVRRHLNKKSIARAAAVLASDGTMSRPANGTGRAVGASQNDRVAVRIAQPAFPVIGSAVTGGWIAMARLDDFGLHLRGPGEG